MSARATLAGLMASAAPLLIKKYPNRRLYDTAQSRYITLEDLAERIKQGADVQINDAQSGADLTQATLTQIILESRGGARLLPVPLLLRLIRMGDESLAEFLTRYVSWSLEVYVAAKQGMRKLGPLNPLVNAPFAATDTLARLILGASPYNRPPVPVDPGAGVPPMPMPAVDEPVWRPEPPPAPPVPYSERIAEGAEAETTLDAPLRRASSSPPAAHGHDARGGASAENGVARVSDQMESLRREIEALKRSIAGGGGGAGAGSARRAPKRRAAKRSSKR